ncbi:histidinol-phosphate aminotransferase (plasmid) [Legionella adelaidensis]|uniref:Histidinol-phosphate aminotransferase n=1 Tax=Legionella adelaidensis TaxID=45056 RepID=A0A0W0R1I6_9GAMM|nr:histidinol-phosphate transaminase [Legionella adelaidensis]KTC64935.1 histidinol-phosphate aminotransferase [Legionella adelaidensis]VEH85618.1 histidinol-phosphate aminotransferase [Legionella adelaidensis]
MTCDFLQLPHKGIQTLTPYVPGKSALELAKEQGISDIIKLASNENPLGCSPLVMKALANMSEREIAIYHPTAIQPLREKLAKKLLIDANMLFLSNGSDALFPLILMSFALHKNKRMLVQQYGFNIPNIQAKALGIPIQEIALASDWEVNVPELIKACDEEAGLIYLANPNNPTGTKINLEQIAFILQEIPACTILLLDEAYHEYQEEDNTLELLKKYPNLIITRTFSKAYGLAGLRLGYAIANPDIISILNRVVLSFTVNYAALVAGTAALDDEAFLAKARESNKRGLEQLKQGLQEFNYTYLPTAANFITIDCKKDAQSIFLALQKKGVIVRPLHPYGLSNFIRVTVGTKEQNNRFLESFYCINTEENV